MSTYSPLSTICLVAWAKRASSRSTGGIWKKPGRKASRQKATSKTTARRSVPVAKSSTPDKPRIEASDCRASFVVVLTLKARLAEVIDSTA